MKKRAVLKTEEAFSRSTNPVLIIDQSTGLGSRLAGKLTQDFIVVYAGSRKVKTTSRLILISYRKILKIPDNKFSYIFLVLSERRGGADHILPLIKKAKESNARLVLILPSTLKESKTKELIRYGTVYPITFFITSDIFGDGTGRLDSFLYEAKKLGKVTLNESGLSESFPVHIDDAVDEVIKTTLLSENKSEIYLLLQNFPLTDLAITRLIIKAEPDIKIQFKEKKETSKKQFIHAGIHLLDGYSIETRIKYEYEKLSISDLRKKKKKTPSKNKKRIFIVFLLFITLPFVLTFLFTSTGVLMARSGFSEVKKGNFLSAEKRFVIAKNNFYLAEDSAQTLESLSKYIGLQYKAHELILTLKAGEYLSEAGEDTIASAVTYQKIILGTSKNPKNDSQLASQNLRSALTLLQKVKTESDTPTIVKLQINKNKDAISILNNISDQLPELIGVGGSRKYLILFQNNMELRPGGGFIGSYGVVTFKNGKFNGVTINDVYDADGKLKGHVEPPYPLRRYAGIKHWYLRDSNFNIDFVENAKKAAYFLNLELGIRVDGVIALDTEVLKNLLTLYGPLNLQNYNQKITEENVVAQTQENSQDNFFPGSTQKKDFLNSLYKVLLAKMTTQNLPLDQLNTILVKSLKEKHIMVVFNSDQEQKILSDLNISGQIKKNVNENDNSMNDFLFLSEANIGGTKGNQFIKKDIVHSVNLTSPKRIEEDLKINYTNTSTSNTKFAGDYLGYLQIVLPENAVLRSISFDRKELPILPAITNPEIYEGLGFKSEEGVEVYSEKAGDKNVFGFAFNVRSQSDKAIDIKYEVLSENDIFGNYTLQTLKQPGTINDQYTLRIYYPRNQKPVKITGLDNFGTYAELKGTLRQDTLSQLTFDK